jgi:uncharacterized protein (TIGR02757 family)
MEKLSMDKRRLKSFLDEKYQIYNQPKWVEDDPISIPHRFTKKQDIEISGFLSAVIAWGNRKSILNNANKILDIMDHAPYDFIIHHKPADLDKCAGFVHRTFNAQDLQYFIIALQRIYWYQNSMDDLFRQLIDGGKFHQGILSAFKRYFFQIEHDFKREKHLSDPGKNSAAKRLNMFLRWMVRKDENGVDFGIWDSISPSDLSCPLDIHSGNVARQLGLLKRQQNDAKAVEELDKALRSFDAKDPVKYDFALFGLGVYEKF